MGFRDYDPGLNRFTTRDMYNGALADMGLGSDPYTGNRYAFTGGNPISRVELDGHCFGWGWCEDAVDAGGDALDSTLEWADHNSDALWDAAGSTLELAGGIGSMAGGAALVVGSVGVCVAGAIPTIGTICIASAGGVVGGASLITAGAFLSVHGAMGLGDSIARMESTGGGGGGGSSAGKSSDVGANNPDVIWKTDDYDGWAHVLERHRVGAPKYNAEEKGAFYGKEKKVKAWIQEVVKNNPAQKNTEGRDGWVYEGRINAGPNGVGILSDKQSRGLPHNTAYGIRVILNPDGSLRTAHPIP
jgi:hypothetical protein